MPPLGETIGPRRAAVSARLMVDVDRILLTVRPRDLLPAVKLMAAVIVQSQHTGQRTARPRRFQEHRLRPRPVRQLPRKFLYLQPVIFVLTFDPALPCPLRIRHRHPLAKSLARRRPPGRRVDPMGVPEMRENWGLHRPGLLPTSRTRRASSERTFRLFPGAWYDRVFSVVARPR